VNTDPESFDRAKVFYGHDQQQRSYPKKKNFPGTNGPAYFRLAVSDEVNKVLKY
jgi:hypothetical protein